MRLIAALLTLAVVGCSQPTPTSLYRDLSAPISSTSRFDANAFSGKWYSVQSVGAPMPFWRFQFDGQNRMHLWGQVGDEHPILLTSYDVVSTGRLVSSVDPNDVIWVLWIDEDHRTAVLGNPSGSFAQIINRTPTLRSDRLQAARDILQFNGYDLSQLKMVPQ